MASPAALTPTPQRMTVEEYLRFEETALERHEYIDGVLRPLDQLIAQSGGSHEHSRIIANCLGVLYSRLKGSPCYVVEGHSRCAPSRSARYFYPDLSIVCGEPTFDPADKHRTTLTNPTAIVEVLSGSTEGFDRGEKFDHYRRAESLREYVIIEHVRPGVQAFFRQPDGSWIFQAWHGTEAVARLRSVEVELPLAELYVGVAFPPADDEPPAQG